MKNKQLCIPFQFQIECNFGRIVTGGRSRCRKQNFIKHFSSPYFTGLRNAVKAELPGNPVNKLEKTEYGFEFKYVHLVTQNHMLELPKFYGYIQQSIQAG